jgi:hypothetical protein
MQPWKALGPPQIYAGQDFYDDSNPLDLNWANCYQDGNHATRDSPNAPCANPRGLTELKGWCSVPNVSPGMSVTWDCRRFG